MSLIFDKKKKAPTFDLTREKNLVLVSATGLTLDQGKLEKNPSTVESMGVSRNKSWHSKVHYLLGKSVFLMAHNGSLLSHVQ